ncbi:hypothetical protein EYF80_032980 [Liparis tanakae]|uniref:Uncharacterized protein n=1 Tax=Liparis tanakae TaxID=230148 RepID=A0A4Z2GVM8_9TELE|nr:hypothetical protein EYF80_032980 [Liparis tanakae]
MEESLRATRRPRFCLLPLRSVHGDKVSVSGLELLGESRFLGSLVRSIGTPFIRNPRRHPKKGLRLVIGVLQEHAVVTVGFEVEGDVSAGAGPEGREDLQRKLHKPTCSKLEFLLPGLEYSDVDLSLAQSQLQGAQVISKSNDVDVIDEDVLQAATEIWCSGQIQVCELSFADGCDCVTVHGEVHLSTLAYDGDIVPVQIVKKAAGGQCRPTVNFGEEVSLDPLTVQQQTVLLQGLEVDGNVVVLGTGSLLWSRVYLVIQSYELKVPWVAMATSRYFLPRSTCSHGCLSLWDGDQPLLPEGRKGRVSLEG